MAEVTSEDREFGRVYGLCSHDVVACGHAASRERIEARVRAECAAMTAPVTKALHEVSAERDKLLAAAKPVLTAEERRHIEESRRCGWAYLHADLMLPAIDRLCPPPKAPPTDAELAEALLFALKTEIVGEQVKTINVVRDALRARGVK